MADEPDPPRKFYQLKPREFEAVNPPAGQRANDPVPPTDVKAQPTDIKGLLAAAGTDSIKRPKPGVVAENEVHAMLRANLAVADAAGLNDIKPVQKFRRRKRDYRVLLIGGNLFIFVLYSVQIFVALQVKLLAAQTPMELPDLIRLLIDNPIMYAMCFLGMFVFSAMLTWLMYGVMDDY